MLFQRKTRDETPLFGTKSHMFSANEVAEATMHAVRTIEWGRKASNIVSLAKDISDTTKGNIKQEVREAKLKDIAESLIALDIPTVRRIINRDVVHVIRTHSAIPNSRKDKAVAQWKALMGMLDKQYC